MFERPAPVAGAAEPNGIVVYETDFGLKDGAVSAMRGVARSVSRDLILEDLTHEIPAFNIWEGAYRLNQTAAYWPPGTVFVAVVDPGVGTDRKNIVLATNSGHYFVAPDNGLLTLVAESLGVAEVRDSQLIPLDRRYDAIRLECTDSGTGTGVVDMALAGSDQVLIVSMQNMMRFFLHARPVF